MRTVALGTILAYLAAAPAAGAGGSCGDSEVRRVERDFRNAEIRFRPGGIPGSDLENMKRDVERLKTKCDPGHPGLARLEEKLRSLESVGRQRRERPEKRKTAGGSKDGGMYSTDRYKLKDVEYNINKARELKEKAEAENAAMHYHRARVGLERLAQAYGEDQPDIARLKGKLEELGNLEAEQESAKQKKLSGEDDLKEAREYRGKGGPDNLDKAARLVDQARRRIEELEKSRGADNPDVVRLKRELAEFGDIEAQLQDARAGFRMDQRERVRVKPIENMLDSAKTHSDNAARVGLERQKQVNFQIALDKLSKAAEEIGKLEARGSDVSGLRGRYEAVRAEIMEKHKDRFAAAEASVSAPENVYNGSDRSSWEARVRRLWGKLRPQEEIVAVRFPQAKWVRGTDETTSSEMVSSNARMVTKTFTGNETLRVAVIVKESADTARVYKIYLRKDLAAGTDDVGFNSDGGIHFDSELPLSKVK